MKKTNRKTLAVYDAHIRFYDGEEIVRTEWGKSKKDVLKTLEGIYCCKYEVISIVKVVLD